MPGVYTKTKTKKARNPYTDKMDQTGLTELVKYKDLCLLKSFGGVRGIASAIGSCVGNGINDDDDQDIARRREAFGSNTFEKLAAESFFRFAAGPFEYFTILILIILMVFTTLSLGLTIRRHGLKEGWFIEVGSIFVAVFLAFSAASTFPLGTSLYKLSEVSDNNQVDVVRSGRCQQISVLQIVVGDVVFLKIGDPIPADGLFLDGSSLQVDQSSMTGEIDFVDINCSENPFLFLGTKVVEGHGRMLVTSVGMNTFWGEMMNSTNDHDYHEQIPLQLRLKKISFLLAKVGLAVAFLVIAVLLVRYFMGNRKYENKNREFSGKQTNAEDIVHAVVGIVAAAVATAMVAIPNGLQLAVRLTLAYFMKRMKADHAIMRKVSACETMGSVTTICTQETGTLMQSQMKVVQFWLGQDIIVVGAYESIAPNVLELISEGVAHNTTASSHTENVIRSWTVLELMMNIELESYTILEVDAFDPQRNSLSGVLIKKKADNTFHVHWKGAAEMILAMCSRYYDASGSTTDLDDDGRSKIEQVIEGLSARSCRCIAFAHIQVPEEELQYNNGNWMLKEDCLSLLGIVGLKSPSYPGMEEAVAACHNAGVGIKMITGDNISTAKAVATECGILRRDQDLVDGAVVEGVEFRSYTHEERMQKLARICVMARSSPSDKLLMVECLKQKGHMVAITDDGTSYPPALREADVVLSMGTQGSKMAKEISSAIIFLDDSFASVVSVLRRGRCIYCNFQKVIQFQITVTISALTIMFVAAISGEVPLTVFQLLWVKLIVEALGVHALALEQPSTELMEKPPVGLTELLVAKRLMWRNVSAQALYQIIFILLTLELKKGHSILNLTNKPIKNTFIFNTFVLCQVFNILNARNLEKKNVFKGIIKRNRLLCGLLGIIIILQAAMVEFLTGTAGKERLDGCQWFICASIAAFSGLVGCIVKFIPVPENQFSDFGVCKILCKILLLISWEKKQGGSWTQQSSA